MYVITAAQLRAAAPKCTAPDAWVPFLNDAMLLYGIAFDRGNVVEFLGQCAHESQEFNRLEENLIYSAERLTQVWPTRFPSMAAALPYANNPHKLADHVYGGRMGNRDEASGDGWLFRGRGLIMATGRGAYAHIGEMTGDKDLLLCPDRLCTKRGAANASAAWWSANPKLAALAIDKPDDDDYADFVSISRIVNGGVTGLAARAKYRDTFNRVVASP